jgi:hypothetical protein
MPPNSKLEHVVVIFVCRGICAARLNIIVHTAHRSLRSPASCIVGSAVQNTRALPGLEQNATEWRTFSYQIMACLMDDHQAHLSRRCSELTNYLPGSIGNGYLSCRQWGGSSQRRHAKGLALSRSSGAVEKHWHSRRSVITMCVTELQHNHICDM